MKSSQRLHPSLIERNAKRNILWLELTNCCQPAHAQIVFLPTQK